MNIIKNADFSLWQNAAPDYWQISGGLPVADTTIAMTGSCNLQIQELDDNSFIHEKKLSQAVTLNQDAEYRLDMRMHATDSFFLKVRLTDPTDGSVISEDHLGWFSFLYWQTVPAKLRSGRAQNYLLEIIFTSENKNAGKIAFELDNITMNQAVSSGLTLFTHSIMQSFDTEIPDEAILQPETIYQTAIRGEYHPCCLGIRTDRRLDLVKLEILDSGTLPESGLKLNLLKKQLLAKSTPVEMCPNQIRRWWITFTPEATCRAGNFELKLKLEANTISQIITVKLKVLDIELPATDIPMLVYFSERYMPGKLLTEKLRRAYYTDMREHGMTSVTVYNNPDADDSEQPDFTRNWQFSPREHQWFKANKKDNMLSHETDLNSRFSWGLEQEIETMLECGLCSKKFPVIWLAGKKTLMKNNVDVWGKMSSGKKIEESVKQWHKHESWPEPLYQVIDEPDNLEDRIKAAQEIFASLDNTELKVRTVTANVAPQRLGSKYNVWVQPASKMSESYQRTADDFGAELWVYDCASSNRNMAMSRALYGFWAQLSGVKGVAQWAYYDSFEDFAACDGELEADNSLTTLSRVGLSPDGPVSTLSWEATREGTVDFRICKLFRHYRQKLAEAYDNADNEAYKQRLKHPLDQVNEVYNRVLDSVPLEAFATVRGENLFYARLMFKPPVGPGNPDTTTEVKRYALLPHIIQIKNILEGDENEN